MPAIQSYQARNIRTGDRVQLHDDRLHEGEVVAVQEPNATERNIVIDCILCGTPDHPHPELHKRSAGALVSTQRNPRRHRDTTAQTDASRKARSNA